MALTTAITGCVVEKDVVPVYGQDTLAEKEKVDEFVEGLLKDPNARVDEDIGAEVTVSVNLGGDKNHVDKEGAPASVDDITGGQRGLRKIGYETNSPLVDQICF